MKGSVNAKVIVHMDIEWSNMVWIRATRRPLSVKWADLASRLVKTILVLLLSATDHKILMKMHNHSKLKSRQWSKSKRHRTKFEQNRIKWSNSALKLRQQLNKDWSKKERKKRVNSDTRPMKYDLSNGGYEIIALITLVRDSFTLNASYNADLVRLADHLRPQRAL